MNDDSSSAKQLFGRKNPLLTKLVERRSLVLPGSEKETIHFVIEFEKGALRYAPGDSLGIFARNPTALVDEIIAQLRLADDARVRLPSGEVRSFREALESQGILNRVTRKFMTCLAERVPQGEQRNRLMGIVDNGDLLNDYIYTRDYVDVLRDFDEAAFDDPGEFLAQLSPIPPRLYSVASAQQAHPDEAHLCVAAVRYETHGRKKAGLCSGFLADVAELGKREIPVYVQESRTFRLPGDGGKDIIMCGPGTGIAPFRAFLEQRALDGSKGRNWIFFGEQHEATDFLYRDELLAWHKNGLLTHLDLAFSRDQPQKTYVQHRMKERARELWSWLQQGAYFYVCGDAQRMAKDVHQTLIEIAKTEGGMTGETAATYVNVTLMKIEKRYLRDVY